MRLLLVSLLAACVGGGVPDEKVVTLAEFPVTNIVVTVGLSHALKVRLDYPPPYDTCLVLDDDVVATAAGATLVVDRGEYVSRFDDYPSCITPSASIDPLPSVSPATFEIHDRTRSITCALDAALVARTATLVPDGPWVASAGEVLTVRWPSIPELDTHEMLVKLGAVYAPEVTYPGGDLLSFKLPQVPAGTHRLKILRAGKFYRTIACDGITNMLTEPEDLRTFAVDLEIL